MMGASIKIYDPFKEKKMIDWMKEKSYLAP